MRKRNKTEFVTALLVSIMFGAICFGEAWACAWIFNPRLTTGTVNFFAALYALICIGAMNYNRKKKGVGINA